MASLEISTSAPAPQVVELGRPAGDNQLERAVWDPPFWYAHRRLTKMTDHVLDVPTSFGPDVMKATQLGKLRLIEFASVPGGSSRLATSDEWSEVESRTSTIWTALSEAQRKKFITTQLPGWFSYLMSSLLFLALLSVFVGFLVRQPQAGWSLPGNLLIPFMLFVLSLGAIGASASIGMNALSLQEDASFEISNTKLVWLRLVVGALFGTLLTFPWAFSIFQSFLTALSADPKPGGELRQC